MSSTFIFIASLIGGLGVALGAFGAHALRARISAQRLENFETAVRYQMYHALALLACGLAVQSGISDPLAMAAAWLFLAGILFFSGSLYLLVFTGQRWLGAITPLGGIALIAGWICLALAVL